MSWGKTHRPWCRDVRWGSEGTQVTTFFYSSLKSVWLLSKFELSNVVESATAFVVRLARSGGRDGPRAQGVFGETVKKLREGQDELREGQDELREGQGKLRQDMDREFADFREEFIGKLGSLREEVLGRLNEEIRAVRDENHQTRLLFERLEDKVDLIAEGVRTNTETMHRLHEESREELREFRVIMGSSHRHLEGWVSDHDTRIERLES